MTNARFSDSPNFSPGTSRLASPRMYLLVDYRPAMLSGLLTSSPYISSSNSKSIYTCGVQSNTLSVRKFAEMPRCPNQLGSQNLVEPLANAVQGILIRFAVKKAVTRGSLVKGKIKKSVD